MSELNFDVMAQKQGLPHESVYGLTQDKAGYMWIATFGGLSRFDGTRIHSYTHDPDHPNSLPDNNARVLLPREDGGLWVGTGSAGMIVYDLTKDDFETPAETPDLLRKSRVFCMATDNHGGIWFGTQYGLAHYIPSTGKFELYGKVALQPDKMGFPSGSIFSVFADRENNLWVGSEAGLYLRIAGTEEFIAVLRPDRARRSWARSQPSGPSLRTMPGKIWIGADVTGIGHLR